MFTISKEFHFEASHQLNGLPETHPCSRIHGHSYVAIFTFRSDALVQPGFIIDYRELDEIKHWIDQTLDHQHLNDVLKFNPTAEQIARYLFERYESQYAALSSVTIKETQKTTATFSRA